MPLREQGSKEQGSVGQNSPFSSIPFQPQYLPRHAPQGGGIQSGGIGVPKPFNFLYLCQIYMSKLKRMFPNNDSIFFSKCVLLDPLATNIARFKILSMTRKSDTRRIEHLLIFTKTTLLCNSEVTKEKLFYCFVNNL